MTKPSSVMLEYVILCIWTLTWCTYMFARTHASIHTHTQAYTHLLLDYW